MTVKCHGSSGDAQDPKPEESAGAAVEEMQGEEGGEHKAHSSREGLRHVSGIFEHHTVDQPADRLQYVVSSK